MLLFNLTLNRHGPTLRCISKHPMLLFNIPLPYLPFSRHFISKHPMLLFNHVHFQANESMNTFQNILCYCLTVFLFAGPLAVVYFKTSYVTV